MGGLVERVRIRRHCGSTQVIGAQGTINPFSFLFFTVTSAPAGVVVLLDQSLPTSREIWRISTINCVVWNGLDSKSYPLGAQGTMRSGDCSSSSAGA